MSESGNTPNAELRDVGHSDVSATDAPSSRSSAVSRTLHTGFIFRALQQHEVGLWLDLLGHAFADKGTPREFFQGNMINDPWLDISGIRVCEDPAIAGSNSIVSTARVYRRRIYTANNILNIGAIGDVATAKSHRRQGIAGSVLRDAHAYMRSQGIQLSVLHTSNGKLKKYYASHGYYTIPVYTHLYHLSRSPKLAAGTTDAKSSRTSQWVSFVGENVDTTVRGIASLYASAMVNDLKDCAGCFVRENFEYWTNWVQDVVTRSGWAVWVARQDADGQIMAYGIVRVGSGNIFGGVLQVQEFFCASSRDDTERGQLFRHMVRDATQKFPVSRLRVSPMLVKECWLQDLVMEVSAAPSPPTTPVPLVEGGTLMARSDAASGVVQWIDEGLMFKPMGPGPDSDGDIHAVYTLLGTAETCVFLPVDAF